MKSVLGLAGFPTSPPKWGRKNFAGVQGILATGGPYEPESIFDSETENGNLGIAPLLSTPSAAAITFPTGGIPVITGGTGRQQFNCSEYDWITRDWVIVTGASDGITRTIYMGNEAPVEVEEIPNLNFLTEGIETIFDLDPYVDDPDDAHNLLAATVTLPSGWILELHTYDSGQPNERIVWRFRITPPAPGSGSITDLTFTDPPGDSVLMSAFTWVASDSAIAPDVNNGDVTMANAIDAFTTAGYSLFEGGLVAVDGGAVPPGNVFAQSPAPGTVSPLGTPFSLQISGIDAPDVNDPGTTQLEAETAIEAADLQHEHTTAYSDTVPAGDVISQDPAPGTLLLPNSTVSFVVSAGEEPEGNMLRSMVTNIVVPMVRLLTDPQRGEPIG